MALELSHELCKLIFDCQISGNALDFHGIQLSSQHFFFVWIQMGIGLPGCFNLFMAQALRYHQDIKTHLDQQRGVGVPIQYNKDKSENPCKIKGFRDLSLFFFRLFFIKIRLCKVGRKGQCYINDKITATGNGGMNGKQKLDCLQRNHRCL